MKAWVVVEIGCIECGETNDEPVIGVYMTKSEAISKVNELRPKSNTVSGSWVDWHPSGGFLMTDWQVRIQDVEL